MVTCCCILISKKAYSITFHFTSAPLRWRHNDSDSVSNHQPHDCLLNLLFGRISKKTSKLRVTGLCVGNSPGPVNSPHKGPVTRKMFPFDDVIMTPPHLTCLTLPHLILCLTLPHRKPIVPYRQNGRHFADNTFKYIFFSMKMFIFRLRFLLRFVPKGPIDHKLALVQLMAFALNRQRAITWTNADHRSLPHIYASRKDKELISSNLILSQHP